MVTVAMPGRSFVAGAHVSTVERVRELWQRLYVLADEISAVEELMERQASWICRNRDRDDLARFQAKWNANDEQRLRLHARVEELTYKADQAIRKATPEDLDELGHLFRDGGEGMAEWFAIFVPKRDVTAVWCPEAVNCDGHVF